MILTSDTGATKKKSRNCVYTIKGFNAIVTTPHNCVNWKKKQQVMLFKRFLCDICYAQYVHTTGHMYTRLTIATNSNRSGAPVYKFF